MEIDIKRARQLTNLLENKFRIFGFNFGLDPLLGLIPGVGDTVATLLSSYLILLAMKWEMPRSKIIKMIINLAIDYVFGSIPLIGDLGDFAFRANTKNLAILDKYQQEIKN